MKNSRRRSGFTLIEVLIVVIIMAVLAATIIPQFSSSTKDAKESSLKFNMHTLRSQIEMYKVHHLNNLPAITDNDLPQLSKATNVKGEIGTAVRQLPVRSVHRPAVAGQSVRRLHQGHPGCDARPEAGGLVGALGGWQYDASNGAIWPNNAEFLKPPRRSLDWPLALRRAPRPSKFRKARSQDV